MQNSLWISAEEAEGLDVEELIETLDFSQYFKPKGNQLTYDEEIWPDA